MSDALTDIQQLQNTPSEQNDSSTSSSTKQNQEEKKLSVQIESSSSVVLPDADSTFLKTSLKSSSNVGNEIISSQLNPYLESDKLEKMTTQLIKPGIEANSGDTRSSISQTLTVHHKNVDTPFDKVGSAEPSKDSSNISDNEENTEELTMSDTDEESSPLADLTMSSITETMHSALSESIPIPHPRDSNESIAARQSQSSSLSSLHKQQYALRDEPIVSAHDMDMIETIHGYGISTFSAGSIETPSSFLTRRVHRQTSASAILSGSTSSSTRSMAMSAKRSSSQTSGQTSVPKQEISKSYQPILRSSSSAEFSKSSSIIMKDEPSILTDLDSCTDLTLPGDRVIITSRGVSFPMASPQRDTEFHALFPDLDKSDMLVEDYACAWQKEILLQGRLYLTQRNLCFYSKIIWTYTLTIPYEEIVSLEKKTVAGFFHNAIEIATSKNKYFFATFMTRDNTYDYILNLWKGIPNHVRVLRARDSTSVAKGDIELTPMAPSPPRPASVFGEKANISSKGLAELADLESKSDNDSQTSVDIGNVSKSLGLATSVSENFTSPRVIHQKVNVIPPSTLPPLTRSFASDGSPNGSPLSKKSSANLEQRSSCCACASGDLKMDILGEYEFHRVTVQTLFKLIYSQESFSQSFQKHYSDMKKFRDLVISDWASKDESLSVQRPAHPLITSGTLSDLKKGSHRSYQYIQPLNSSFGPKETLCKVEDTIENNDVHFICVTSVSQTPDVPSGGCFETHVRVCFSTTSQNSVVMKIYFQLVYTQSTWLKSVLDRAVKDGVAAHYRDFTNALKEYIKQNPPVQIEVDVLKSEVVSPVEPSLTSMESGYLHTEPAPIQEQDKAPQQRIRLSRTESQPSTPQSFSFFSILVFIVLFAALALNVNEIRRLNSRVADLSKELLQQKELLAKSIKQQQQQQVLPSRQPEEL